MAYFWRLKRSIRGVYCFQNLAVISSNEPSGLRRNIRWFVDGDFNGPRWRMYGPTFI